MEKLYFMTVVFMFIVIFTSCSNNAKKEDYVVKIMWYKQPEESK